MSDDFLAPLRAALASATPPTQPLFAPDKYPGLKITQSPAAATDLDPIVDQAFEAAGWPAHDQPIPRAEELTPAQRALADLVASVPGVPLHGWAIPQAAWARRRWLGLDPPGAVERHDLARALHGKDDDEAAAILDALPIADRLEAYGDLALGAYRVDAPGNVDLEELGDAGKTWAPAYADRLLALFAPDAAHADRNDRSAPPDGVGALVCRALIAAGLPIEERWDVFVPSEPSIVGTLPSARRDPILVRRLEDEFPSHALREGLALIAAYPSELLVDHLIARADDCLSSMMTPPRRVYLARLRDAVAAHPTLAARVDARLAALPPLPALRCTRKLYPRSVDELTPGQRTMFGIIGQGWETDDGPMVTLDDDEAPVFGPIDFVSAYEIADEQGARFEALFYMDEDGSVCRANTTNQVMMASQMNLSWNLDDATAEALQAILCERPTRPDAEAED